MHVQRRRSALNPGLEKIEMDRPIRISIAQIGIKPLQLEADAQLFAAFADQAFFHGFPGLALAARKLPAIGAVSAVLPLADQNFPFIVADDGSRHVDPDIIPRFLTMAFPSLFPLYQSSRVAQGRSAALWLVEFAVHVFRRRSAIMGQCSAGADFCLFRPIFRIS